MFKRFTTLVVCCAILSTPAVWAQSAEERAQAVADTRQGLLKVVVSYFGPIVAMAREQIPYDGDVVKNNAEKIAALLPMIPDVFRNDTSSYELDTEALPDIWQNMDDFTDKTNNATQAAQALAAATAEGQGAAMQAFGALGGACKACHDNYRQQD